jgi:hypothetical protein
MLNAQRKKYQILMQEIEDLEDKIEELEGSDPETQELQAVKEKLADQRNELARVSDGCGTPHHH